MYNNLPPLKEGNFYLPLNKQNRTIWIILPGRMMKWALCKAFHRFLMKIKFKNHLNLPKKILCLVLHDLFYFLHEMKSSNTWFRLIFTDIGFQSVWLDKSLTLYLSLSNICSSDWLNVMCSIVSAGNSEALLVSLSLSKTATATTTIERR